MNTKSSEVVIWMCISNNKSSSFFAYLTNIMNIWIISHFRGYNADTGNDGSYHDISSTSENR